MIADSRRVRHLRLRAPDAASARRVAIKLEDALRTATLPDAAGRVLLVRRLAIGRVDRSAAPSALALRIEHALARSGARCVHGDAPEAAHADAVWFRDTLEVHVALARRVLRGGTTREWFWPLALPALPFAGSRAELLRASVLSLAALPEAPVAVPVWIAAVAAADGLDALHRALGEADATLLLRACGLAIEECASTPHHSAASTDAAGHGASPAATPGTATLALDGPPVSSSAPSRVARALAHLLSRAPRTAAAPAPRATVTSRVETPDHLTPAPAVIPQRGEAGGGEPTAAGGLALLLNALARLGYAGWLRAQPEWASQDIARRVLSRVLTRLRVPPEEPAWRIAELPEQVATSGLPGFVAPPGWREGLRFDPTHARAQTRPRLAHADRVAQMWEIALRRWLRRHARLGLAELVMRPALLSLSATHLDLRFDLAQIDLRIRRAGLDLDPGWLPWFGYVVGFRYEPGAVT